MRATKLAKGIIAVAVLSCMATVIATNNASAQTITTEPVGYYATVLVSNSDTYVSIPFIQVPAYQGLVHNVTGANVLTASNSPNWTVNQWATTTPNGYYPYYVQIVTGTKEGAYYDINANNESNLTVGTGVEDLGGVVAGDVFRIIPFWNLGTAFPGGTGIVTTVSTLTHKTELYFPNLTAVGINNNATNIFFYYNTAWRKSGPSINSNFNDWVILPDEYFFARQQNASGVTTTAPPGQVVMSKLRMPIKANSVASHKAQDNYVIIQRPAVQSLNQSGLSAAFQPTLSTLTHKDELYVYDNTIVGKPRSATQIYFFYNTAWRKSGPSINLDFGPSNVFLPGTGYYIRRATNDTALTMWVNSANYTN